MLSIHEKMASSYKKITTKQIWKYLSELYNLNALNESEIIPFPNKENDFELPDGDFSDLKDRSFPRLSVQKTEVDEKPSSEKLDKAESGTKPVKHEPRHMVGTPVINTPDNSPKRKRTRQTPSNASPATPEPPPPKRRR
ncbi:MRG/MORF4L-binding protein-like isoform X2 [Mya arenaria]|nr:MRG/MORF4L-binding protein-like isoform X2 [Mya arenaria]